MGKLYQKLEAYAGEDYYPYHMPGHKRSMGSRPLADCCRLDITEIDGFDDLHQPDGILLEAQERANALYGAEDTYYLINGSTAGILSAVSCAADSGEAVLAARNCHKSVYHAAYLKNLELRYLYPDPAEQFDITLGISAEAVEYSLLHEKNIKAVIITSPTYEGIVSDVGRIAKAVHKRGIPLIVDEAHGAHFGFHEGFPRSAVQEGADIVIHSLHKTLPALTQTALLHVRGELIDRERLKRYLSIYQTSSPSYLLMASMDSCMEIIRKEGGALFETFLRRWEAMLSELRRCRNIKILDKRQVICAGMKDFDVGKLVISVKGTDMTGQQLYDILLKRYRLQMEMAQGSYVLAMFTVMDRQEGYDRLCDALLQIDGELGSGAECSVRTYSRPKVRMRITQALDGAKEKVPLRQCEGRTAAAFLNLYPPGIPVIAPGEQFDIQTIFEIEEWDRQKLSVRGMDPKTKEVTVTAE